MVGTPNIKITTSMIDEFQSPFKDNPNTYIKISQDGLAQYLTPDEVAQDIGGGSGGENTSTIWTPGVTYRVGDIVSYNNSLFQCRQEHVAQEPFDFNKWQLLAGYFKTSKFFYDPVNEITSVVLDDAVANKESLSVNINNLLLQSNNYTLADDGKTLTFNEPIEPGTNIEVIVYGNMIIPTNVSQVVSKSFTTTEESTTEFPLGEKVLKKDLITVNIENSVIMNSEWDLNETLDTVILKNAVPVGTRVQLSWFNNLEIQVGATYTPHINKVDRDTTLSWTNDGGLENPVDSHIYDGVTFVPSQSKTGTETTLSWTNNGNLDNPENVVIKDGATFTPSQTKIGLDTTLSWTNDVGLPNPENVVISDGVTYTPHTTQDAHEATISFTNNKELENPETISIYTNYAQRIVESFTATENQTTFVASHEIYDKSVLSVNVGNTELTAAAYSLGADKKTVTLVNGLSAGTLVDLKYFYNLNIGTEGITFTPELTPIDNGYTLSWTNDGGLENPVDSHIYDGVTFVPSQSKTGTETTLSWTNNGNLDNPENVVIKDGATFTPSQTKIGLDTTLSWTNDVGLPNPENVVISDGVTYTPHTTQDAHEATISFTNNKELENPETISIYTNYAQRIVESFTATENQTTFVASHEIYDKSVLSVNVGNTELTAAAYSLGADKKTVTLVNGLSAGTLVDLKYFYNLNIGTEGITFTPELTPIDNGYTLSWTNDGGLDNPTPVNITSGSGINPKGDWSAETAYIKSDYVTYEDTTAQYGYLGLKDNIPAGTELTNTTYWMEMYKILKTYIAATIVDWGE